MFMIGWTEDICPADNKHATAVHHSVGGMLRLGCGHSAEENRHRPRAHLVIGNLAARKCLDQPLDFRAGQHLPVALLSISAGKCITPTKLELRRSVIIVDPSSALERAEPARLQR